MAAVLDTVEVVAFEGRGRGLRALVDLARGSLVVSEPPIYTARVEDFSAPAFLARPDVARLMTIVEAGCDGDGYTAEAKAALDAVVDVHAAEGIADLGAAAGARVWALDDCFRRPAEGDAVRVDGLASDRGRPLNGLRGVVERRDGADRWAVATARGRKSVRDRHLKTAGGIFRTNAYFDSGSGHVFETLCRANHACDANATKAMRDRGGARVVDVTTTKDVRKGDEITVSYVGAGVVAVADRRAYLAAKYNFHCTCAACEG
jgi:hypothetical protein